MADKQGKVERKLILSIPVDRLDNQYTNKRPVRVVVEENGKRTRKLVDKDTYDLHIVLLKKKKVLKDFGDAYFVKSGFIVQAKGDKEDYLGDVLEFVRKEDAKPSKTEEPSVDEIPSSETNVKEEVDPKDLEGIF